MSFVTVTGLTKSYGAVRAVDDFSFEVKQGEIYALVGPDGAGKTTIIRTLCNLVRSDKGSAFIDGLDVSRQFEAIKSRLGYMPQTFSLYPDLSVEENLRFYGGIHGVVGKRFRDKTEVLYGFSNLKPFASRRAGKLSGGMKQKLALSCALIYDPKLLLLDEPTTGVDPLSRQQFWKILLDLKRQGVTIIVSTPYMDEVARADRACFVFEGRKLVEDRSETLSDRFDGRLYFLDMAPSVKLVDGLNDLPGIDARRFGSGLHLYLAREDAIENYSAMLTALGVDTTDVKEIRPNLEDCFIQFMEQSS